jgi:predicted dehydrogenase
MAGYRSLELIGVFDHDADKQAVFTRYHGVRGYPSMAALLADDSVDAVVNVTNPGSHVDVSHSALLAGKHVYSEKPLALNLEDADLLAKSAAEQGVLFVSAPCSLLGEAAQTTWTALLKGTIGTPRMAYAEMEGGPILSMHPERWHRPSGIRWPYRDELTVGWTLAHAGYALSWLTAFFGPARRIVADSARVMPVDHLLTPGQPRGTDHCVASLTFDGGVRARITIGMGAPGDQSLRIIGDEGMLRVEHTGDFASEVTFHRWPDGPAQPLNRGLSTTTSKSAGYDFALGVAELANAVEGRAPLRLPFDHARHNLELALALERADTSPVHVPQTSFAPVQPPSQTPA